MACSVCSENFKLPVSLPCGHVFCSQCIFTTVQTVKPLTPFHRCPTCRSWYNIAPLDTKTVPSNLRPFVTPSVRPLHLDVMRSDSKTESTCTPDSSQTFNESSMQTPTVQSSSVSYPATTRPPHDKVSSEMARLRAENDALRNNCSLWRKRAETHREANLNLMDFARAVRDQASQIARDRNDLENRCLMLKKQLDGEASYSDEMQKYRRPTVGPDFSKQIGEDGSRQSVPSPVPGSSPPSGSNNIARSDPKQSRKRPRISGDGNRE